MAILNILEFPDLRLRRKATPVTEFTPELSRTIDDMFETMYAAPGIGLAATQVNIHKQLIVIDISDNKDTPLVFINPRIEIIDQTLEDYDEGCLSFLDSTKLSRDLDWSGSMHWTATETRLSSRLTACWQPAFSMKWTISTANVCRLPEHSQARANSQEARAGAQGICLITRALLPYITRSEIPTSELE
jgi:hypothetical protein